MACASDAELIAQEVEMLVAMFCEPGAFVLHAAPAGVLAALDADTRASVGHGVRLGNVSATVHVAPSVEVAVNLPTGYPTVKPPVLRCVSAAAASRAHHTALASRVDQWLAEQFVAGEPCVVAACCWLQTAADDVLAASGGDGGGEGGGKADDGDGHAAGSAGVVDGSSKEAVVRQWLYFIGFYTPRIIRDFCAAAEGEGVTGFLVPGKPSVACLEGTPAQVSAFLRVVRTDVFATVPSSSKKMNEGAREVDVASGRLFEGFAAVELYSTVHKRKDLVDLAALQAFLDGKGLGHVFATLPLGGTT